MWGNSSEGPLGLADSPTANNLFFWLDKHHNTCVYRLVRWLSNKTVSVFKDHCLVFRLINTAMGEKKRKAGSEKSDRPSKKAQTDRVRVSHVAGPDIAKPVVGKYSRIDEH